MPSRALLTAEAWIRGANAVEPAQVKHVLVLEYRLPLGCVVHMTPVFEAIKRSASATARKIAITVATRGLGLQVLRHSPFVDHLLETPDPTVDLAAAVRALRSQMRTRGIRPQCVLTGASDQRKKIALLAMLGSRGWRGGYTLAPALYHRPLTYDATLSLIGNNLRLAKLLACDSEITRPRVFLSRADAASAAALLQAANPQARPVVVMVTQTSGGQNTGWHTERFVEVIRHASDRGLAVVYAGTASETSSIEAIRQAAGGIGTSLAGKTTVSELAAVLALSDVAVTLDTGTLHVGRAAGVPMVILGPSWQKPLEWMPLGVENVRILRGQDRTGVPEGYRLDEVSSQAVIASLADLLAAYPPSAAAREARLQAAISSIDHLKIG
jgi:ADP-heptose:LPS heptosyltransferase